jgi:Tol biopolymer transport system component
VWSPDGSKIAAELYEAGGSFRIGIIPVTGGPHVTTGPVGPEFANGAAIQFSPDGKFVLATYRFNGATYLLPVDGGEWSQVKWTVREENSWQRRAQ